MPRVSVDFRTASKEVYKKFCDKFPHINITFDQFKSIVYTYTDIFKNYIMFSGEDAKLPWGLGSFTIVKKRPTVIKNPNTGEERINYPVDWKSTKELNKIIYHLNYHTDGYRFNWVWFRSSAKIYQTDIWSFKPSRETSRELNKHIKSDPVFYQIYQLKK